MKFQSSIRRTEVIVDVFPEGVDLINVSLSEHYPDIWVDPKLLTITYVRAGRAAWRSSWTLHGDPIPPAGTHGPNSIGHRDMPEPPAWVTEAVAQSMPEIPR